MTKISRHKEIRPTGHCKFDQVVICLIWQIGSPQIINTRPFAVGKKYIEQFVSLTSTQLAVFKQVVAAENILVFVKQRIPHQGHTLLRQARCNNAICRSRAKTGTN